MENFGRNIEVLVGPLPEYQGGGSVALALKFIADGTNEQLRIKFAVKKHIASTAAPTTIEIYNLAGKTRSFLKTSGLKILLSVGWQESGFVQIFQGSLLNASHRREGPDIITTLYSLAGHGSLIRGVVSKTFTRSNLIDIIKDIASNLQGIVVDQSLIKVENKHIGSHGLTFVGSVSESLDRLARTYGFSWWINNGIFHALKDDAAYTAGNVIINTENGLLLRAEPMLASPAQILTGVSIHSFLTPFVDPGNIVQLDSKINPDLNGSYKVHTLSHSGDSHADQWTTRIESWVVV